MVKYLTLMSSIMSSLSLTDYPLVLHANKFLQHQSEANAEINEINSRVLFDYIILNEDNFGMPITLIVDEKTILNQERNTPTIISNVLEEAKNYENQLCNLLLDENKAEQSMLEAKNSFDYIRNKNQFLYLLVFNALATYDERKIQEFLLYYLSTIKFNAVFNCEETFVIDSLKRTDDIIIQETALNTILLWGKVTDYLQLKNVSIKNTYLEEDLKEFLKENGIVD